MSNRMANPGSGRTKHHAVASSIKQYDRKNHVGKYATARDISARAVELKALVKRVAS